MIDVVCMVLYMQSSLLERIASRPELKYAMEPRRRKKAVEIIFKLTEFSMEEKFKLIDIIFANADNTNSFLSVSMELKSTYCIQLLEKVDQ